MVTPAKWTSIPELDDYEGDLLDLSRKLVELAKVHGPQTKIRVDAGHNNVAFDIKASRKKPPVEMDSITTDDPLFWRTVDEMRAFVKTSEANQSNAVGTDLIKRWADQLESTNTGLLADIYNQLCEAIRPYTESSELPASVVGSMTVLLEDFKKKLERKRKRIA